MYAQAVFAVVALVVGVGAPAVADATAQDAKCLQSYKHDRQGLVRLMEADATYYDAHEEATSKLITAMDNLLRDPQLHDLIPQQEAGTAQFRDTVLPIVAQSRDTDYAELKRFKRVYRKCFTTDSRQAKFSGGVQQVTSAFRSLYTAHEDLFWAESALVSADTGTATQKLQEARVDVLPASDQFERGMRKLRSLH